MFQIWGWWPPSVSSQCGCITVLVVRIILTTCKYFRERVYICLLPFPQQKANQEMKTEPGDWGMGGCPLPQSWYMQLGDTLKPAQRISSLPRVDAWGRLSVKGQGELQTSRRWNKSPGWDETTRNNKKLQLRTENSIQTIVFNSGWTEEYNFLITILKNIHLFIWLSHLTCSTWELQSALWHMGSFAWGLRTLSYSMWDLVPCCDI